ncbi:BAHD acyltransferase [Camellia lanceoleosa]|uniref:BAHD acyltransferase n=1 Tax=Camellia lanceoleosa TaxID=1840588 RepID=A0ACC0G237_9ERIC|nr:BAHD acyltransferase [Camellia lanceoleosa]
MYLVYLLNSKLILTEFHKVTKCLKELGEVYSNEGVDYFSCTSVCNGGIYEADFGWRRPVWVSLGGAEDPLVMNLIFLMDTGSGDGIEAWVSLSEEEMDVFESDLELLEFALLDPSPLELANSINCHARM